MMSPHKRITATLQQGFTLIEMMVIAPIVILLIGAFIALIVNLTGEVMTSRASSVLSYNVQDALNRIEQDVKLSTAFLATNNIDVSGSKQGFGGTTTTGSTTNFTNVDKYSTGGSYASIILNTLATTGNPISDTTDFVYLSNQPNPCSAGYSQYSRNKPMAINVVYFVDSSNTLWRRVLFPGGYLNGSYRCNDAPWQVPTCIYGYSSSALTFCRANDEKLIEGVHPSDFAFQYYSSASATSANATATNSAATDTTRNNALLGTPTVGVTITARQTIAGRDISRSASMRATRVDANASDTAEVSSPATAPNAPVPTGSVSDGHIVTFTWPKVATATSYRIDYKVVSGSSSCTTGSWITGSTNLNNSQRSYPVIAGNHTDKVCARVTATNAAGTSPAATADTIIPLWAPLLLKGGWTSYSASAGGYNFPAYTKTRSGVVLLRGLVKSAGSSPIIATLPSDYLPNGRLIFGTSTSPNAAGRIDVLANGDIQMYTGSATWISLETIRFIPTSSTVSRITPTLQNSWVNYANGFATASYARDTSGRVTTQGLVKSGVITDNTAIYTASSTYAPPGTMHFSSYSTSWAHIGVVTSTGAMTAKGTGTNSYLSLNSSYISASASVTWANLSLQNSWVNYGGAFSTAQYTKDSNGIVQLKGLIRNGSTSSGSIIATLPAGYRPKGRVLSATANATVFSRVDVSNDGAIIFYGSSNSWFALDGISFVAEQ